MNLFLRQAKPKDVEFMTELSNQLGYKATIEKIQGRLFEILHNVDNCMYVVVDNDNVIGWIHGFYSLRVESDSFVEIGGLVVDENYRRKGVGKMLVTEVIEWACSKKCDKIRVRCNTLRKETHVFYDRIGFNETKEQKIFDMELA
ncbi:MAG: GNAT family N-acetyltransferase [Bacteroidota bacterium]